jgi:hypothetical protein
MRDRRTITCEMGVTDMVGQAAPFFYASAILEQIRNGGAGLAHVVGSTVAGVFILIALAGSWRPQVDFFLLLGLMAALAVVDLATKAFPASISRLAPGVVFGAMAVLMLFHH